MADAPLTPCPKCGAPCTTKVEMRGGDHGWGTTDAERTTYRWATPSPPVAAPPATPVVWVSPKQLQALTDPGEAPHGRYLPVRKTRAGLFTEPLYAQPQPQPAQPLTDEALQKLSACGPVHCENGKSLVTEIEDVFRAAIRAKGTHQ